MSELHHGIEWALTHHLRPDNPNYEHVRRAILCSVEVMRANLSGFVVKDYDVVHDASEWIFGKDHYPCLLQPGSMAYWPDDPMTGRMGHIPLGEFLDYLHDWYWPRSKEMREASV